MKDVQNTKDMIYLNSNFITIRDEYNYITNLINNNRIDIAVPYKLKMLKYCIKCTK